MMRPPPDNFLLFIVGPTACGKSDFAVEVAERFSLPSSLPNSLADAPGIHPEIINCDSVQFFAGVEIGAAKPEPALLARAKHHLVGHVELGGTYTAGDFRRSALRVIEERNRAGVRRFLPVGGSGFYVQALEKGMYDVPEIPADVRQQLERDFEEKTPALLHEELRSRDPEAASKIQVADRYRIFRALEILRSHPEGGTLTEIRTRFEAQREPAPFRVGKIGVFRPRDILRTRVIERTRRMLANGLIDEVQHLRSLGLSKWAPLLSVGYKEVQDFLDGRLTREELEPLIVTSTMQLAKRQMTWFKRDKSIHWFDSERGWDEPLELARQVLI